MERPSQLTASTSGDLAKTRVTLNCDGWQDRFSVVAGPRNHLYRTGHPLIQGGPWCLSFTAELDHFCNLANDFYLQTVLGWANGDALGQAAEDLESLVPDLWLVESVL